MAIGPILASKASTLTSMNENRDCVNRKFDSKSCADRPRGTMLGDQKYPAAITSTFKRNVPRDDSKVRVLAALCRASG